MTDDFDSLREMISGMPGAVTFVDHVSPRIDIADLSKKYKVTLAQLNAMAMLAFCHLAVLFENPALSEGAPDKFSALLKRAHGGSLEDIQIGVRDFIISLMPEAGLPTSKPAAAISGITLLLASMEDLLTRREKEVADAAEAKRVQAEATALCATEGHEVLQQSWRISSEGPREIVMACLRCGYTEPVPEAAP